MYNNSQNQLCDQWHSQPKILDGAKKFGAKNV